MFGALKHGFRSTAGLILVRNVVGELRPKRTLAASRGFLAAARLSCLSLCLHFVKFFCNLTSSVIIDGVVSTSNGANVEDRQDVCVGTQMFSRCGQQNVGAVPH